MGVITTRRLEDLRAECDTAGIAWSEDWGRLELMDALRTNLGGYDPGMEIDPMKAKDLKPLIDWGKENPFDGLAKFFNSDWVMEPKLDGVRLRMFMGLTGNTLNSGRRSVRTFAYTVRTDNFPHLRDAVIPELAGVILDGEILAPSGKIQSHTGVWTNSLLNASVALTNANPAGSVATQERFGKATYNIFDILAGPGGESVQDKPYHHRRRMLEVIVKHLQAQYPDNAINLVPLWESNAANIDRALAEGYEGVMIKSKDGIYRPGKRGSEWNKVKTFSTADAFIVGYAAGEHGNEGLVGSLDLAVLEPIGSTAEEGYQYVTLEDGLYRVRPVAQVGNLVQEWRRHISAEDGSLKPEWYGQVVEWMAQGIGKNGRARHAHMIRLRPDKSREDCKVDQLDVFPAV